MRWPQRRITDLMRDQKRTAVRPIANVYFGCDNTQLLPHQDPGRIDISLLQTRCKPPRSRDSDLQIILDCFKSLVDF